MYKVSTQILLFRDKFLLRETFFAKIYEFREKGKS
jgi:hypothetical protein